jgi:hypothetical protein
MLKNRNEYKLTNGTLAKRSPGSHPDFLSHKLADGGVARSNWQICPKAFLYTIPALASPAD